MPLPQRELLDHFQLLLQQPDLDVKGKTIGHHIVLDIPAQDRHYWSPQLNFRVEEFEGNQQFSIVAGLVGPRPNVWTLFVFIYFALGVMGFFVSAYGFVEYSLGRWSNLVWGFPITIALLLSAYRVSKYGEKLAADQTERLQQFVRRAITFTPQDSSAA